MKFKNVVVFGYNEYSREIYEQINSLNLQVDLLVLSEQNVVDLKKKNIESKVFDLDDNWKQIEDNYELESLIIFCALSDDAKNIFLTISLRAALPHVHIIGLSSSASMSKKILLAGADKVVSKLETATAMMVDILENEISSKVLDEILYDDSPLKIAQIIVTKESTLYKEKFSNIQEHKNFNIIIFSLIDNEKRSKFIFSQDASEYIIEVNDVLIVVGYDEDIKKYKNSIGV